MLNLASWARDRGYRAACGDPAVLDLVRADIAERLRTGELDADFHHHSLEGFAYPNSSATLSVRRVVVIAVPRPAHLVTFQARDGACIEAVVPPTYRDYQETIRCVLKELSQPLAAAGYTLIPLRAPLKAAAVRLGLATYGRNNIAYVEDFGSYHQLVGGLTDAPLEPTAKTLDRLDIAPACRDCRICGQVCPTDAVGDRFLIHAERCLTYINENDGPWPTWVPSAAHRCLVGCLACQEACPRNGPLRYERVEPAFSSEETEWLLSPDEKDGPMAGHIREKLEQIGLVDYDVDVVARNLRAITKNCR